MGKNRSPREVGRCNRACTVWCEACSKKRSGGNSKDIVISNPCQSTVTPSLEESELAALRARYLAERDKRLIPAGEAQYERPSDDLAETYAHDPFKPAAPRDPVTEDIDVVVLGGGWTGVLAGYHLSLQGVSTFRHIDHGAISARFGTGTATRG